MSEVYSVPGSPVRSPILARSGSALISSSYTSLMRDIPSTISTPRHDILCDAVRSSSTQTYANLCSISASQSVFLFLHTRYYYNGIYVYTRI